MQVKSVTTYQIDLNDEEAALLVTFIQRVLRSDFGAHRDMDCDDFAGKFAQTLIAANPNPPF